MSFSRYIFDRNGRKRARGNGLRSNGRLPRVCGTASWGCADVSRAFLPRVARLCRLRRSLVFSYAMRDVTHCKLSSQRERNHASVRCERGAVVRPRGNKGKGRTGDIPGVRDVAFIGKSTNFDLPSIKNSMNL